MRRMTYGQTLNKLVIKAQIEFLADEPEPLFILAVAVHNKIKNLRPNDTYGKLLYKRVKAKKRYAYRCHRSDRGGDKHEIGDTVFAPRGTVAGQLL